LLKADCMNRGFESDFICLKYMKQLSSSQSTPVCNCEDQGTAGLYSPALAVLMEFKMRFLFDEN
jgi:hypothetical protein